MFAADAEARRAFDGTSAVIDGMMSVIQKLSRN